MTPAEKMRNAEKMRKSFDKAVKSLTDKLQPEYEHFKKLKERVCSPEREKDILDAKRNGFSANFGEQDAVYSEVKSYNSMVEGMVLALTALSRSYGIETFVARRFRGYFIR